MKIAFLYDAIAYGDREPINWADPDSSGLTGTDLICAKYAEQLSRRGHAVTVYCHKATEATGPGGYRVVPYDQLATYLATEKPYDVAISVSSPNPLAAFSDTTLRIVNRQVAKFTFPACMNGFDRYVDMYLCPSDTAKRHVSEGMPKPDKFAVLPNGCDPDHFGKVAKVPGRVVYCSSPDRGLHLLLMAWPEIKRRAPEANLKVFYYSLDSWLDLHTNPRVPHVTAADRECARRAHYIKHALPRLEHLDVQRVGGISHRELERELDEAMVLGFPVDTLSFTETFSVATLEACAAGAVPVVSSCDSIGQIYGDAIPVLQHPVRERMSEFVDAVVRGMTDDPEREATVAKAKRFAGQHSWERLGAQLDAMIDGAMARKFGARCSSHMSEATASMASHEIALQLDAIMGPGDFVWREEPYKWPGTYVAFASKPGTYADVKLPNDPTGTE